MGRPKLGETALRRHVVTVRLNDGEHEELRRQAGKARLRVPEFIRQRVLERRPATTGGRVVCGRGRNPTLSVCALTVDRYPMW